MEPLFKAKYEQLLDNLTEKAKTGKPIDFKEYVVIKLALITIFHNIILNLFVYKYNASHLLSSVVHFT